MDLWAILPVTMASTVVFCGLALMSDRPRGAFWAQNIMALAGIVLFVAIARDGPLWGASPQAIARVAIGVLAAAIAGMLYHLYLGRFDRVWAARQVFTLLFLALCLILGLTFLSLM